MTKDKAPLGDRRYAVTKPKPDAGLLPDYWIMGTGVYKPFYPPQKFSDAELICKCETVEQAHAIRNEILKSRSPVSDDVVEALVEISRIYGDVGAGKIANDALSALKKGGDK